MTFEEKVARLKELYEAFNRREIEAVLEFLATDVAWPNMIEMTTLHGQDAVRQYWLNQFETIEPNVQPRGFEDRDGAIIVKVHQKVTVKDTGESVENEVLHTYTFENGYVASMVVSAPEAQTT